MRIGVLGPLVVEADDRDARPAPLRGPQARRLVVALAMHAPDPVSVDVLHDLLWPDGSPSANALQAQVSKLRKALAPMVIDGSPSGYALVAAQQSIDATRFESLAVGGREAAAQGDHERAASMLGEALSLWRGRPFDEIADHPLGQAPSVRLTSMRAAALAARIESDLALGRVDAAATELEALVAQEPLVERWWALLMLARYRQGRQADALRAYSEARSVLAGELGLEPGPELRDLEARVLRHDPTLDGPRGVVRVASRPAAKALPARLSSFIGRVVELDALAAIALQSRLTTIVGPGGAGKTSTAIELARRLSTSPGWPAHLVELAPLSPGSGVAAAVAEAVGAGTDSDRTGARIVDDAERAIEAIGDREVVVVLDNCEHVLDDAAAIARVVLGRCAGLRVIATSREPLGVPGETTWTIPPLRLDEGVDLLVARASAVAPEAIVQPDAAALLAQLVERLDGLPLAIELAAARLRSLALTDVVARLDDRFALLSHGVRGVEPRQQTLRSLVDWSHDLLDDVERAVFRRLAAFTDGAAVNAAAAVCADDAGISVSMATEAIARLVDKSLVVAEHRPDGTRLRMLQTLADYAAERLLEAGEAEVVRRRHARVVADMVAPAEAGLRGHEQRRWLELLRLERGNVLAALDHALAVEDADLALRVVAPLGWYFYMVDEHVLGVDLLGAALSCPGRTDPRLRSFALGSFAWLAASGPDLPRARIAADTALRSLTTYDDPATECYVLCTSIMTEFFSGEVEECAALVPLARAAAERSNDRWARAMVVLVEAELTQQLGAVEDADRAMRQAADAFAALGDRFAEAICVTEAAEVAEIRGDYDRAIRMLEENLVVADQVGFSMQALASRARIANLEILRGNLALAAMMHHDMLDRPTTTHWLRAMSLLGMANIGRRTGDVELARRHLDEAWALPRTHDVPLMRSSVSVAIAYTADLGGDGDTALRHALDGLDAAEEFGSMRSIANAVEGVAGALAVGRDPVLAARMLGAADAIRRASGGPMLAAERFDVGRAEDRCRRALGDRRYAAELAVGAATERDHLAAAARALAHRA